MTDNKYIIDPENLKRETILKKLATLFLKMLEIYSKINQWIFTIVPKAIGNLLEWADDHWFYKLIKNEFIANFFSVIVLYLLAQILHPILPPIAQFGLLYWAGFNIIVICGRALQWDIKSQKILGED